MPGKIDVYKRQAFKNMKDDPEYREKILSALKRDLTSSFAPLEASIVLTVGEMCIRDRHFIRLNHQMYTRYSQQIICCGQEVMVQVFLIALNMRMIRRMKIQWC